jgi:hypothetical protein
MRRFAASSGIGDRSFEEVMLPLSIEKPDFTFWRVPRWPLQIAAAAAIGFAVWWLVPRPAETPIAILVETNGARWENSSLPTNPGAGLDRGRLHLLEASRASCFRKVRRSRSKAQRNWN